MVSTLTQRSLLYCRILRAIYLNCTSGTRPPNFLLPLVQNSETTRSPILSEPLGRRATARLEKSLCLCLAGLRIRRFDPIAEASELPDHFPSAPLLRLFGDSWASFIVTNSLVQDQPNQGRKSLRLCLAGLWIRRFDPIAQASELPDHSRSALLLGLVGDRRAPFFVTNSLVQDQPNQSALRPFPRPATSLSQSCASCSKSPSAENIATPHSDPSQKHRFFGINNHLR